MLITHVMQELSNYLKFNSRPVKLCNWPDFHPQVMLCSYLSISRLECGPFKRAHEARPHY